jgi:hypothetical protein
MGFRYGSAENDRAMSTGLDRYLTHNPADDEDDEDKVVDPDEEADDPCLDEED